MLQASYRIFLKGLLALLPIAATLYLIFWLIWVIESLFGSILTAILPHWAYLPGMGIMLGIAAIFGFGLILETWFMRSLWHWGEALLDRMPLVRQLYGWLKQLVDYVSDKEHPGGRVVLVKFDNPPMQLLGLVTLEQVDFEPLQDEELVAVFLPFSYQIGGYTVYLPRARLEPIDMDPKEALRLTLTAGVGPKKDNKKSL